jgi:hypothetical protein
MADPCLQMEFANWVIELWYLTPLLAIFQLYRGVEFYWWSIPEYPEKTTTYRKSMTNFIT